MLVAFIAQGLERWSSKPEVGSSILPEGIFRHSEHILFELLDFLYPYPYCILIYF